MMRPPVTCRVSEAEETPDDELERQLRHELKWRNRPEWAIKAEMEAALRRRGIACTGTHVR